MFLPDVSEFAWLGILVFAGSRAGWLHEAKHKNKQGKNARHRNYTRDDKKIPPQTCHQSRHQLQNKLHN
jgi:hypothetical protein